MYTKVAGLTRLQRCTLPYYVFFAKPRSTLAHIARLWQHACMPSTLPPPPSDRNSARPTRHAPPEPGIPADAVPSLRDYAEALDRLLSGRGRQGRK